MRTVKELAAVVTSLVAFCGMTAAVAACGVSTNGPGGGDGGSDGSLLSNGGRSALTQGVFTGDGGCLTLGSGCSSAGECCSGDCTSGTCQYPACKSDNLACTSDGSCCSQSCVGGTCAALNTSCKTLGNACAANTDCCSQLCAGGTCQPSSFCVQPGDGCAAGTDCCTGACAKASGQALGTCAASPPAGPANCGLVDGQSCGGTSGPNGPAQATAGVPACGGPCCSRACAPWGPTGVLVCQPASGCHVVGDLCTRDGDCCGSAGLPGGSHKPVTCVITAPNTVGVCRNPMGCKPDGDVCKLKTSSCNSSCDCCSGNCETEDTCKQDNVGVPRCAAAQCVAAGAACASSANCCGGAPCVPNPVANAAPPFICHPTLCVAACGQCTNNGDCCPGSSCVSVPGGTHGMCGPCSGGVPQPDAGSPTQDAGSPPPQEAGTPNLGDGGSGSCSLYGQLCQTGSNCCNSAPCTNGRCQFAIQ